MKKGTIVALAVSITAFVFLIFALCIVALQEPFAIDLVVTWVDSADVAWRERLSETKRRISEGHIYHDTNREPQQTEEDIGYFSVLSALRNMPWLNTIWIATERPQRPGWLDRLKGVSDIPIRVIHHDSFFHKDVEQPTFNSNVIESQMFNIRHLAEHFIMANDDFIMLRPTQRSDFFTAKGTPVVHTNDELYSGTDNGWIESLELTKALSHNIGAPSVIPHHTYLPLLKSVGRKTMNRLHTVVCRMKPIRSPFDFVPCYVVSAASPRHAPPPVLPFRYYDSGDAFADDHDLLTSICINGDFTQRAMEKLKMYFLP